MASALSSLANNLAEGLHKGKAMIVFQASKKWHTKII